MNNKNVYISQEITNQKKIIRLLKIIIISLFFCVFVNAIDMASFILNFMALQK